jgi:hypothetical protein
MVVMGSGGVWDKARAVVDVVKKAKSSVICTGCPSTGTARKCSRECSSHLSVLIAYGRLESTSYRDGDVAAGWSRRRPERKRCRCVIEKRVVTRGRGGGSSVGRQ